MIIGLSGYGQSGKDTIASYLAGYGFKRLAFADALKDIALDVDPLLSSIAPWHDPTPLHLSTVVKAHGWEHTKREFPDSRIFLQRLGVAVRQHLDPDAWVKAVTRQFEVGLDYVITDVRFPNEADALVERGAVMVRVHRPGVGAVNAHHSETALDAYPFAHHVYNDGTLEKLNVNVNILMSVLR